MPQITLHIRNITGKGFIIQCDNTITIKDLKKIIAQRIGDKCEHYYFDLIFNRDALNDNDAFCNNILQNDSILYYLMRLNLETEILLEIKDKLGFNLNWDRTIELSQWNNILLHNDNNLKFIVKHLTLSSNSLIGKIPTEIGQLITF